jgi:hypothetical protein
VAALTDPAAGPAVALLVALALPPTPRRRLEAAAAPV